MTTQAAAQAPAGRGVLSIGNPLNSVRKGLVAGFGLLVLILVIVVAGSAWLVREYQSDTALMEEKANTALLIQGAESHVGTAGLMLQRFAIDGDQQWLSEILTSADVAGKNLTTVREREAAANDTEDIARLQTIDTTGNSLRSSLEQVIGLRASGDTTGALITLDTMVGPFREYRAALRAAADDELAEVAAVQADVQRSGNLAFWLLVTSGVLGVTVGVAVAGLIARSILRPLTFLETTANTASKGDLSVRAPVAGPRELAKVGESLNHMMDTVQEQTEELRLSNEELRERNRQVLEARTQAASDGLTGLLNHRKFHQRIREVVAEAETSGDHVGLIMLDVDNFKQVNDTLGHLKGDELLRELASTMAEVTGQDNSYRYGGDEFSILLAGADHQTTRETAERLLHAVTNPTNGGEAITVSLGVASYPEVAGNAEELIYRSDMALNWAKSSGKNQVGDWHSLVSRRDSEGAPQPIKSRASRP